MSTPARLYLKKGVRHRILDGHPWVFATEIDQIDETAQDGGTVDIFAPGPKGKFLGRGIYNSRSQIVARRYASESVELDAALLSARLDAAIAYRGEIPQGHARRLVWSESDQLPGLIVDRYDDVLVLQTLTLALAQRQANHCRFAAGQDGSARHPRAQRRAGAAARRSAAGANCFARRIHAAYPGADCRDRLRHRSLVGAEDRFLSRPGGELSGGGGVCPRSARARLFHEPGRVCADGDEGGRGFVPRHRRVGHGPPARRRDGGQGRAEDRMDPGECLRRAAALRAAARDFRPGGAGSSLVHQVEGQPRTRRCAATTS